MSRRELAMMIAAAFLIVIGITGLCFAVGDDDTSSPGTGVHCQPMLIGKTFTCIWLPN